MRGLLVAGAAFAAGWFAKRQLDARAWPVLASETLDTALDDEVEFENESLDDDLWPMVQPHGDNGVLGALSMLGEHQVAAAETALNRPLSEAALTLAAMLRDEHRDNLASTNALIESLGVELEPDPTVGIIESRCSQRRFELASTSDDEFEQTWLDDVVDDHERMLEFLDTALRPAARDTRVSEHLRHTRDHLAAHLAEARMLA